jgi:hypothetical protein
MDFKEKPTKETIRIKNQKISVSVLVAFGKDGEHFVEVSPTISVSGYGTTAEEAKESLQHNLLVFMKDIMAMPPSQRDIYLGSLGFEKEKFAHKNFSKMFIDKDGVLQGIEGGTLKTKMLQTVA